MILTKKGLDLPISGAPSTEIDSSTTINTIAILGPDYVGLKPTMLVKEGDTVSSGQKLFEDKKNPGTYITSPSSGVVESINRGEKRRFLSITIDVDDSIEPTKFIAADYESPVKFLVDTGALSYFKTRPYNRIPSKEDLPNAIFINACDTNPLAIDPFYLVKEDQELFNAGLTYIASINKDAKTFCAFQNDGFDQSVEGINYNQFNGPHPAGLTGTHIHFLYPVGQNRTVWSISWQEVVSLGYLLKNHTLRSNKLVSLGGPNVHEPKILNIRYGSNISEMTAGAIKDDSRIISGSVLNGRTAESVMNYLGAYDNLIQLGYERTDKVELINQFTVRGGVVDLYSSFYSTPLRVDFFGDEIDDIRRFDIDSQAMTEKLQSFQLFHGSEIALEENSIKRFKDNWRNYFQKHDERYCEIFQNISSAVLPEGYEIYMPLLQDKDTNLIDYFDGFSLMQSPTLNIALANYNSYIKERYEEESIDSLRPVMQPKDYFFTPDELSPYLSNATNVSEAQSGAKPDLTLGINDQIKELVSRHQAGKIKTLFVTASEQIKLDELNKEYGFKNALLPFDMSEGLFSAPHHPTRYFYDKNISYAYINVENYLGQDTSINKKVASEQASLVHTFDNPFHDDELVIHVDYGVGIYKGLTLLKTNTNEEEFIQIEYLDKELLYVPIRQAYLVSKYQVSQVENIPLDSLSSLKWRQKKEKAEAKAKDHAAELLDIESRRSVSTSPQLICSKDEYQKFSNDFPYIPTSDQQNCINDVIKDLALIKPMNRVICGDVGFGKTEIAMRAAFVCVQAKKQAMILAPSTVLSDQHHESFTKRFSNFPMNISILTRHTSPKARAQLYEDFKNKKIDILVGTHALLNNDIDLSSLGLLVIDEEHRFGTKQKEIIKSRQTTTHILYMSATPIPRTLNLVYSGLKDFSYLYTPPMERLSVKTFLNVQNNQIIKNAIDREVTRGGQVFIVQNDIGKMDNLKNDIQALQPNARIGIAHGRLSKQDISQTMGAFNSNSIDILLCTTIVEMGLDIPNANTIIVIDAQNFGLSQLHQLRGRVGRALRQSYCYLLIPTQDIKKNAKNKLDSLVRYSDLGSGYFIAQEDLEIRGAGDFLGIKQSGHIEAIGLSMYLSMLKSAVNDLKGIKTEVAIDSEINFNDRALLPDTYMPVANERLKIYRSLNDAKSTTDIHKIFEEIKDRCGKPSDDVLNLVENSKIRVQANILGIRKIYSNKDTALLTFHDSLEDEVYKKLIELIQSGSTGIKLVGANKLNLDVSDQSNKREAVSALLHQLS